MLTIKLSNGVELTGLELNGNNFIAPSVTEDSTFDGGLSAVEIKDHSTGETSYLYDAKLIQNVRNGSRSWFILAEKTEQDKLKERIAELENALCELDAEM